MNIMESKDLLFKVPIIKSHVINNIHSTLLKEGTYFYALNGLIDSAKGLFLYAISSSFKKKLVILPSEQSARKLFDEYRFYDRRCRFYPAKDMLFYEADLRSNELTAERIRVIKDILKEDTVCVFTSVDALLGKLPPVESFQSGGFTLSSGDTVDLDKLVKSIVEMGYTREAIVSAPGEFCVRGGIIDIFPLTEDVPYRIELWSDEVDTVRQFDAETQKSIEVVDKATIFPASEEGLFFDDKRASLLTDFFNENSLVFIDEPTYSYKKAQESYDEFCDGIRGRLSVAKNGKFQGEKIGENALNMIVSPDELYDKLQTMKGICFCGTEIIGSKIAFKEEFEIATRPVMNFNNSIPLLKKEIAKYKEKGFKVIVCGQSRTRQKRLYEGLSEDGVDCYYIENPTEEIESAKVIITLGAVSKGVEFIDSKVVYISENDIFSGIYSRKRKKSVKSKNAIESFRDLNVGDYVVHENYGLGIYRGIEKIEQEGKVRDYLKISYAKGDALYILATQLNLITKYSGGEGHMKLSSLSGLEWKRTKGRVKSAVGDMAKELVKLYATRQQEVGYACGKDTAWQKEFEETFPFEETPGQALAIKEVKADLESNKIMDRLICGDVGFGKTEVALRAAFKMVQENKQVVILSPTTVLAKQHYNTFTQRLRDYPVSVDLLSRFRTPAENKETVEKIGRGEVDILIGTHRALSKDVKFKDLGLLVIDEEQRFGVRHKERIKQLKSTVDVLSLTATPIPRTLHMSLIGIRDMSLLDEAPLERLPVQTFVFEQNDEIVREAIERELSRDGQVYYVANRVKNIEDIARKIQSLVPNAHVAYAHGQMTERRLEDIMSDFIDKQIDVLVATTIIEIGLDISNVNTIIIHDADTFGLSQLYQLRGRVGRSSRRAYAFLMYRRDKLLKEVAQKRLSAIREFSDLGSGFKIAMRDLEIRGAGNLLGKEQHGHMEAVGYELYCKLLSEAIRAEKGENLLPDFETSVDIKSNAHIPSGYIENEALKLEIYKRISFISDDESEEMMIDELIDRFGDPPESIINLIRIARLRDFAHKNYITKIHQKGLSARIELFNTAPINPAKIPIFIDNYKGRVKFIANAETPHFILDLDEDLDEKSLILEFNDFVYGVKINLLEQLA